MSTKLYTKAAQWLCWSVVHMYVFMFACVSVQCMCCHNTLACNELVHVHVHVGVMQWTGDKFIGYRYTVHVHVVTEYSL